MRSEFRYLVFISVMFVLLSFSACATITIRDGNCIANEDVLFMFSGDNGHVATYDYRDTEKFYEKKVCVTKNAKGYTCSGNSNIVLRIAGVKDGNAFYNAHVEEPSGTNFNDKICYGDVGCSITGSCDPNKRVVRVSDRSNAHVADLSFTAYTNYLCCGETGDVHPPGTCRGDNHKCCSSCKQGKQTFPNLNGLNGDCAPSQVCCEECEETTGCSFTAEITKPVEGSVFRVNSNVAFEEKQSYSANCPNIRFKWSFEDSQVKEFDASKPTEGWNIEHKYTSAGEKEALLELWSKPDKSDLKKDSVKIWISGCGGDGTRWYSNDRYGDHFSTTNIDAGSHCEGFDGKFGEGGDDCCPTGMTCVMRTQGANYCRTNDHCRDNNIKFCSDYKDKENCEKNFCNVKHGCAEGQVGKCAWVEGKCVSACTNNPPTPPDRWDPSSDTTPWCKKYDFIEKDCDETTNEKRIEWKAVLVNPSLIEEVNRALDCKADFKTYPCGERMKLPFFSLINVLFVTVLLFAYYCVYYHKKR